MTRIPDTASRDMGERPLVPRRQPSRFWSHAMLFTASVVLANGLFGERGLADTLRARRSYAAAAQQLEALRQENAALKERVRLLSNDPTTIEAVARAELGLARPDEIVVTVRDAK